MRILASILLTLALAGCAASSEPVVTEMPSAEVNAPQSEAGADPMEAEGSQAPEQEQTTEPNEETSEKPTTKSSQENSETVVSPTPTPTSTKTTEPTPTPTKTQSGYTMAQVAEKNSESSCWVVIERKVYDLTDWIRQHPGGRGAVISLCGTDGTNSFKGMHGGQARPTATLDMYLLGPLSQ